MNKILNFIGLAKTPQEESVVSLGEMYKNLERNKLSKYLAPVAYDKELQVFFNQDETVGFLFECVPVLAFGQQSLQTLKGLFQINYPNNTVIQITLFADPDITYFLKNYKDTKQLSPDYIKKAYEKLSNFYDKQKTGNPPVRNFRVFIALKLPVNSVSVEMLKELKTSILETLQSVNLSPYVCGPEIYLEFIRKIINGVDLKNKYSWCENTEINQQAILSNTEINFKSKEIQAETTFSNEEGKQLSIKKYFRCITAKSLPPEISPLWAGRITGVYDGISGDVMQINTPFWYTLNIIVEDLKFKIHSKANLILGQQSFGSFVASLRRKQEEFYWATDALEKGEKFFRVIPIMWLYSEDEEQTRIAVHKAIRLWEATGAVMQEDATILLPLFVYSLPFGCYAVDPKTINLLDRDFIVPSETLPAMAPFQADYMGTGEPALMFVGRKGQIIGIDLFSKQSSSYNFYIAAPTGKGKSFTTNYIVTNYYGAGVKIRIVDIGGSYRKLTKMFNGKFLEFSPESDICINPFSNVREPQYDIPVISNIILQMAISATGQLPAERQESMVNLINAAVKWAINKFGESASIDHIQEYLSEFPKYYDERDILCEGKEACLEDFKLIATHLAFNISKFTSTGVYGKWFNGKTNFDISKDDFVVLELEHLKSIPDLFKVVVLQVLNAVTLDLYLSNRQTPRMVVLDEAWQFLQDTEVFQKVIEEGYRRARKYRGSFGIITQSVLDLEQFGRVGQVINSNSAFKFFLESGDVAMAKEKKIINYDEFTMQILSSVKYNAPKYSEIFIHSDTFGFGVVRLMVDPYSYYVYTSNPAEIAEIENMVKEGMSYEEAIENMVKKYRSGN